MLARYFTTCKERVYYYCCTVKRTQGSFPFAYREISDSYS